MRKIEQLSFDQRNNSYVVCDDGSIWCLLGNWMEEHNPLRWERAQWPAIPQDDEKESEK